MSMTAKHRFQDLIGNIKTCDCCLHDIETGPQLRSLPFFLPLPNNVEELPYTYLFIAMEPSGNWLGTEAEGRRKVSEGYVNFATQLNDYILVFAIQKYLLREGEGFHITDLGKCSLPPGDVCERTRERRYELCLPWLVREYEAARPRCIVSIGRKVADYLRRAGYFRDKRIETIMHYSGAAIRWRAKFVDERGEEYESFIRDKQSIAVEFSRFVRERVQCLKRNNGMSDSVMRYMEKKRIPSGKEIDYKLLFVYKKQFGKIMEKCDSDNRTWRF